MSTPPQSVADYSRMAIENVGKVIGVDPDYSPDTLPLVDEYLRRARATGSPEVRSLIATTVGVYFGEVMLRLLDGWWNTKATSPLQWRVELRPVFLCFHPVGMAGEVLLARPSAEFNGSFTVLDELKGELEQRLLASPRISEEEYFSLCGRCDSLQIVVEWLLARNRDQDQPDPPLEAEDYLNFAPLVQLD